MHDRTAWICGKQLLAGSVCTTFFNHTLSNRTLWRRILLHVGMNEPRDSKVWSGVDRICAEDRRWHGLELQSFTMQLLCSCSYREFFQQDDEYRFEETGKDQMIDPGLDKMAGGFVDVGVILVLNLGISELVYSNDLYLRSCLLY